MITANELMYVDKHFIIYVSVALYGRRLHLILNSLQRLLRGTNVRSPNLY